MVLRPGEDPAASGRSAAETPGGRAARVRSARTIPWHRPLTTAWKADGRDPDEIGRLDVVVP
jgi:hypothetical protein